MPSVPTNIGSPNLSEIVNDIISLPNNYKLNKIVQEEHDYSSLQIGAGKTSKKSKSKLKSKSAKKPIKKTKSKTLKKPVKKTKSKTTKNPVKKIDTFTKEKLVKIAKKHGIKVSSKGVSRTKEQIYKSLLRKKLI